MAAFAGRAQATGETGLDLCGTLLYPRQSVALDPIAVVQRYLSLSRKRTLVHLGRYDQGAIGGATPASQIFPDASNLTRTSDTPDFAENRGSRFGVTTGRF